MFDPAGKDLHQWSDMMAKPYEAPSTLGENFAASIGQLVDEESTISRYLDHEEGEGTEAVRDAYLRFLIRIGTIDEKTVNKFKLKHRFSGFDTDYNGLAEYANKHLPDIEKLATDKDIQMARLRELDIRRNYRDDIFRRSTTGGKVMQFAGGMIGSVLDPVVAASMFVSIPLVGVTRLSTALRSASLNAARVGGFEMGVQGMIEPFIHSWKEEIGAPYTIEDSIFNVLATGVFGATVGGGTSYLGHVIESKQRAKINKQVDEIVDDLDIDEGTKDEIKNMLYEQRNISDDEMTVEEFLNQTEIVQEKMANDAVESADGEPAYDVNETSPEKPEPKKKRRGKKKVTKAEPREGIRGADQENVIDARSKFQQSVDSYVIKAKTDFGKTDIKDISVDVLVEKYEITVGKAKKVLEKLEDADYAAKSKSIAEGEGSNKKKLDEIVETKVKSEKNKKKIATATSGPHVPRSTGKSKALSDAEKFLQEKIEDEIAELNAAEANMSATDREFKNLDDDDTTFHVDGVDLDRDAYMDMLDEETAAIADIETCLIGPK